MAKEIPLLFTKENRDLVRQGLKTETRREMKPQPVLRKITYTAPGVEPYTRFIWGKKEPVEDLDNWLVSCDVARIDQHMPKRSPYGCPRNEAVRYWMREPVRILGIYEGIPTSPLPWVELIYLDDDTQVAIKISHDDYERIISRKDWRRPTTALHMLRSFTRTWLNGVKVWPERLGDMSEESAIAEGIIAMSKDGGQTIKYGLPDADGWPGDAMAWQDWQLSPVDAYRKIWESINGPNSWNLDKWVWAIKFQLPEGEHETA